MGAQPDTSTSAPEVRHGIRQILAPIFVAKLLATYLASAAPPFTSSQSARRHSQGNACDKTKAVRTNQRGRGLRPKRACHPSAYVGKCRMSADRQHDQMSKPAPNRSRNTLTSGGKKTGVP